MATLLGTAGLCSAGKVTIRAGARTLASVRLNAAKCAWTFPAKLLRPGTYRLTASYASSNGYQRVTSAKKTFTVTK